MSEAVGVTYFKVAKEVYLKKGVCFITPGAANWYHWLIEILPTIMLMQNLPTDYDDYPLLVPEEILSGSTFRETLDLFIGTRPVIALDRDTTYHVGEMVVIPLPASGPFNMHDHQWPVPQDYVNNIGVMQQFRTQTLESLGVTYDGNGPKRLFLARAPGARSYNQDDILEVARAKGFEIMHPERLSFREQVQIMHNADFVAGPTGAAWANSVFMRPGTQSLIWALKEYDCACFFANLGHVAGCQTTYCFVEADTPIKNTSEALSASYMLSPKVFSDHLDALL
ncbi:glycosyltransferase family 61 protein [Thalassobacter stenotrophicus]|uniref:glycosyltransferase family 61 protein n=1 Tax=Thalassobacter stenotrophicus TaxID=266809 RepID=UPI0022A9D8AF|nr:glycosyltransferase family 61 protein [Thalassobacter stenotrophicus]UYP67453.1 glycosyltransferase family 61 protein [Thalassobacter stenotrophicus]